MNTQIVTSTSRRRLIYDVAVTLDGFIAGPDEDISMFPAEGGHLQPYLDRLATYTTVLMGRRTYEFGYRFGLEPGTRAYPHMDHHIVSGTLKLPGDAAVTVVARDCEAYVQQLRHSGSGDIYLCGGGALAGYLANRGLISHLRLKIAPVMIGSGTPVFYGLNKPLQLQLVEEQRYENGVLFQEYGVTTA